MEERTIKRLLIILAASIIVIMLIKVGLTRTYTTLNKVVAEKKQAEAARLPAPQQAPPAVAETTETPATSSYPEAAASEAPATSSVSESR